MDIVVVGAGVAGLTAADLLSKAGTVNQNQESPLTIHNKNKNLSTMLITKSSKNSYVGSKPKRLPNICLFDKVKIFKQNSMFLNVSFKAFDIEFGIA